jgi:pilus assembly protein CpaF
VISPASGAKAPAFSIVIHEKGGTERREVFETSEVSMGRVQGNHIVLPKGNVSKRHARLLYRDGRFIVTDLNSTNGTYVNRRRIAQATIVREGDRIYVGDFVLRIEPEAQSADAPVGEVERSTSRTDSAPPSEEQSQVPRSSRSSMEDLGRPTTATPSEQATPQTSTRSSPDGTSDAPEQTDLSDSVATLISRVVERLGGLDLRRTPDPALEQRVEPLLREIWRLQEKEAPGVDGERVLARARAELLQLGPLGPLLSDSSIAEIGVPRFDHMLVARAGRSVVAEPGFSSEASLGWALHRLCEQSGMPLSPDEVAVTRRLQGGATLEVSLGAVGQHGMIVVVRRPRRTTLTLDELVRRGAVSRAMATFLQACIQARLNILVVGGRDGGPETLLGALSIVPADGSAIWAVDGASPPFSSMARLDVQVPLERLHHAVQVAARVPAVRLVADMTSAGLAAAVLDAIGDGADGVVACRCGAGLARGMSRLAIDLTTINPALSPAAARELVTSSFDVVIEVAQQRDGRYRVMRVAEFTGTGSEGAQPSDVYTFVPDRTAAGGAIEGTFVTSGTVPQVAELLRARGIRLEAALFSRPLSR